MKLIPVGTILGPHGVKGHVTVKSFTDPVTGILQLPLIDGNNNKQTVKLIRLNPKGGLICRLNEINDRTAAETARGLQLFCFRIDLPEPVEDEFYMEDLKGLKIVDKHLRPIGSITDIFNFGAGDIIEVKFNDNTTELLLFTKENFPVIDKEYAILERKS